MSEVFNNPYGSELAAELYPGVINDTVNRALGMEALFLVEEV